MSLLDGLAEYIGAASGGVGVAGLSYSEGAGGNVFVEALPQAPDTCVALYSTGGPEADTLMAYDEPHVQITVRGDQDPRTALALWRELYSLLHGLEHTVLPDGTHVVASIAQQSGPVRIGPDENGRHRFSLNLRLHVLSQTDHRP